MSNHQITPYNQETDQTHTCKRNLKIRGKGQKGKGGKREGNKRG